ncbi:helix-turn-helix domain-containing protein [Cesiribacter sp. SM1]|uniref:helix-turn-helix domain-containing protein n=1 Tax=Cesiribacter sp. SM1 TaxID=2861196 RepID=UPI001CD7D4BA|nr:helix-turn-helix transcriptional regulator [Cesiribacter sp. SM1]
MAIGERIKTLRKEHQLTQQALADKVGLTYVQIGRYETGRSTPSSDVLSKLAQVLNTTTDFLMSGSQQEAASAQLADKELLRQFHEVQQLNPEDKHLVKTFLDAFLTKRHIQRLAH